MNSFCIVVICLLSNILCSDMPVLDTVLSRRADRKVFVAMVLSVCFEVLYDGE